MEKYALNIGNGEARATYQLGQYIYGAQLIEEIFPLTYFDYLKANQAISWDLDDIVNTDLQILSIRLVGIYEEIPKFITKFSIFVNPQDKSIPEDNELLLEDKKSSSIVFTFENLFLSNNSQLTIRNNFNAGGVIIYCKKASLIYPESHRGKLIKDG